jgi:hypothetical protein
LTLLTLLTVLTPGQPGAEPGTQTSFFWRDNQRTFKGTDSLAGTTLAPKRRVDPGEIPREVAGYVLGVGVWVYEQFLLTLFRVPVDVLRRARVISS